MRRRPDAAERVEEGESCRDDDDDKINKDDHDNGFEADDDSSSGDDLLCSCCSDRTCLAATLLVAVLWFLAAFVTTPATVSDAADTDLALKYDTLSSLVRFSNALIWRSPSAGDTMHQAIGEPPDPMKLDALIVQEGLRRLRLG